MQPFRKTSQPQPDQSEKSLTPAQQKAAQEAIEAARQMEQARIEGDTKKAAEMAEEVIKASEKYLKDRLQQENEAAEQEKTK
jgi:hypothetical protein